MKKQSYPFFEFIEKPSVFRQFAGIAYSIACPKHAKPLRNGLAAAHA